MKSEPLEFRARPRKPATLDPASRTELTEAVHLRLTSLLAKRYAARAPLVAVFLGPLAARYRAQAAQATSDRMRRWFEQHAAHVETWLAQLIRAKHPDRPIRG